MFTSFVDKVARDVDDEGDKEEDGKYDSDDNEGASLDASSGRSRTGSFRYFTNSIACIDAHNTSRIHRNVQDVAQDKFLVLLSCWWWSRSQRSLK